MSWMKSKPCDPSRESTHLPFFLLIRGQVLDQLSGADRLAVRLFYGSGLQVSECLRLRVQDITFEMHQIIV